MLPKKQPAEPCIDLERHGYTFIRQYRSACGILTTEWNAPPIGWRQERAEKPQGAEECTSKKE